MKVMHGKNRDLATHGLPHARHQLSSHSLLNTMTGIDLFAGVGGMSTGAIQAGIDVALAVECDKNAATAYRRNHPGCDVFSEDIRHLSADKLKSVPRDSAGTIVFGGPPCQGFSYSNTRTRKAENQHNWLFEEFVRVVGTWLPDFFVFENVQGIINTAQGLFLNTILDQFDRLRYSTTHGLLNALSHGVPQDRTRFFLVGTRTTKKIRLPQHPVTRELTVRDAIADLPDLDNGASIDCVPYGTACPSSYARRLRNDSSECSGNFVTRSSAEVLHRYSFVPPGGNWEDIPAEMMKNYKDRSRCHTRIYHRLHYDRWSTVIGNYRKNMLIHPSANRGLSVREAARIQSFPDSYQFCGSIGFQQQQVGNAVPPLLARAVFEAIRKAC